MQYSTNEILNKNLKGGEFYRALALSSNENNKRNKKKYASMLLNNFGIPGLRYLPQPAFLKTGSINAEITDNGSSISIDFLGERANRVSRLEQLPSGRKADEQERQGVINYMLYDAIPELELRVHDYFDGFPTLELSEKYKDYHGKFLSDLTDEQKNEILDAAQEINKRIMGESISSEGLKLLEKQRYGTLPIELRNESINTEQRTVKSVSEAAELIRSLGIIGIDLENKNRSRTSTQIRECYVRPRVK